MEHPDLIPLLERRIMSQLIDSVQCADWLDLMCAVPPQSVDLVLSDIPYNTTACEWETDIDLVAWWFQCKRVLKSGGAVVMTGSQPFTSKLVISNFAWFRYEWIWEKSLATGYLNANRNPMKAHENVLVFYEKFGAYYPQMEVGESYRATRGAVGGHVRDKTVGGYVTVNEGQRYPRSVQKIASEINPLHPTQKPVALFEYLIRTYTQPGAIVLDPFVGSGTTAVAARNTKRHWICGDLSQEYVLIARDRLRGPFDKPLVQKETQLDDLPLFAKPPAA